MGWRHVSAEAHRTIQSAFNSSRNFINIPQEAAIQNRSRASRGFVALVPHDSYPSNLSQPPRLENGCADAGEISSGEQDHAAVMKDMDPSEKWKQITVEMWRDAVYTNQTYFGELISDTAEFVKTIAEHIKLSGRRVSLVEVGCGTGEFVRAATDDFRTVVGVDFNKEFIDFCKEHVVTRNMTKSRYLQGDACQLYSLLKTEFPKTPKRGSRGVELWDDTRVVACVGNTIGIIPEELRPKVYEQMAEVAGNDGVLVMVYWNARWFGDACLNFYHANPKLCGTFEGESVDFKNTTLTTPMKYKTKWTSVDEARAIMEDLGMEIISLREKGKGVFVAARRF
jgi:SAM-dependent methyltransferase